MYLVTRIDKLLGDNDILCSFQFMFLWLQFSHYMNCDLMLEFVERGIDFICLDRRVCNLFHVFQKHVEQVGRSRHSAQ